MPDVTRDELETTFSEFVRRADKAANIGDWHVVDERRGTVVARFGNRLRDPGNGNIHEPWNLAVLTYGGDGRWAGERDVYDVANFGAEIVAWVAARDACS